MKSVVVIFKKRVILSTFACLIPKFTRIILVRGQKPTVHLVSIRFILVIAKVKYSLLLLVNFVGYHLNQALVMVLIFIRLRRRQCIWGLILCILIVKKGSTSSLESLIHRTILHIMKSTATTPKLLFSIPIVMSIAINKSTCRQSVMMPLLHCRCILMSDTI